MKKGKQTHFDLNNIIVEFIHVVKCTYELRLPVVKKDFADPITIINIFVQQYDDKELWRRVLRNV